MPGKFRWHPFSRLFEALVLVVLLAVFVRTASSRYYSNSAEPLEAGSDPRWLLVDLVSLQLRAQSTRLPHQVRFLHNTEGFVRGYEVSVKPRFGPPWEVLKTREFASRVQVATSQPRLEFAADGTTSNECRIAFSERRKNWLVMIAGPGGEMRLLAAGAPIE